MFKSEKMKAILSAALTICIIGGIVLWVNFYKPPVKIHEQVKEGFSYFRDIMKDPDSLVLCGDVIFHREFSTNSLDYIIGFSYNAKNGFGGRSGIKKGVLKKSDGKWYFFAEDEYTVPNQKPGQHPLEAAYENVLREIEVREKRLAQVKAGEVEIEESVQEKIREALRSYSLKESCFSFYDGKDVAKAIKCEYYE